MVSIQSTVQPPERLSINEWFKFIYDRTKPKNTIKEGGLYYVVDTESFLNQCKSILVNEK